ncbi:CHAP domain-containing protein [Collinsella intestinalis]|nr:CHAP domain-containing protein [Collinsella intestinalis]
MLYVDAIKTDGTLETKSCALSVSAEWSAASLSVSVYEDDHANTVLYGQELQISVVFSEDSNLTGMQYNFGWQFGDGWGDWFSLAKDSEVSSDNSFSFIPDRTGTYTVFADAIGTDGRRETVSTKIHVIFPFSISGAVAEQRNLLIGQETCFAPIYTGDLSTAQLNYVWSYDGSWSDGNWSSTLIETGNYTNDASFIFTPPKYGEYDLYLDVVYPDGSTETFSTSVSVSSGWSTSGITIDKETPQYVNTELIISANVMGERSRNVLYNYVVQRNGNEWSSTLMDTGDYTEEPVWSFIPEKSGDYVFYIDVVDKNTGQQVTINRSFRINKTWHLERLDLSFDSPMRPYSNVTMKPVISGDTTGLRFNYVWQGDNWYVWDSNLKHGDYSNQSSATVTISNGGTYGFYIDVIDQNGEIERAEVAGIRARYAYDIINRIEGTIARQSSLDGTYVENKVLEAGGYLCNNRRGYWCGALVWYGFYENGFLDLWGSSHMQVDPEYLANEFRAMGRYYNGTTGIQRGDIIFFYWTPWRGSQYITHVAYVTGVSGSTVTVAEGNMGYSSIYHTYSLWSSNIRGFARPAY